MWRRWILIKVPLYGTTHPSQWTVSEKKVWSTLFWTLFVSNFFLSVILSSRNNGEFSIYPNNNNNNNNNSCSNFNYRSSCFNNNKSDDDNCWNRSNNNNCSIYNNRSSCFNNNKSDDSNCSNCPNNNSCCYFNNESDDNNCSNFNSNNNCFNNKHLRLQWGKPRSYYSFFPFKYILSLRLLSAIFREGGVVLIAPYGKLRCGCMDAW